MADRHDLFHLAIPAHDLKAAEEFYVEGLGCRLARKYDDRITLDFFGDQLVCHRSDSSEVVSPPDSLYPRHFGVTFRHSEDFEALYAVVMAKGLPLYHPLSRRFEGLREVHSTFVISDPSGNLIEFKHYDDPEMMY